jgi:hypothetical protein
VRTLDIDIDTQKQDSKILKKTCRQENCKIHTASL